MQAAARSASPPRPAGTDPGAAGGRLNHLDALRGLAMLLGIVLHASFIVRPQTGIGSDVLDWTPAFIHSFRMPLFFLMAGIFGALVVSRRGEAGFVGNRAIRIALPLAVGIVTIVPLQEALEAAYLDLPAGWALDGPQHLWFLELLLVFYAAALLIRWLAGAGAARVGGRIARSILSGRTAGLRLGLVASAVVIAAGGWGANPALTYVPQPEQLLYYGAFFGLGWILFSDLTPLRSLERAPAMHALAALALSTLLISTQSAYFSAGPGASVLSPDVLGNLIVQPLVGMLAITALYGYARRICSQPRGWIRYLVDASYWMYLMHIVVLWPVQVALEPLGLPWWLQYPALCSITAALLLISYAAFVRYTAIGRVLHGPRRRRRSPRSPERPALERA